MIVLFIRKFERDIYENNNKIAFVYFNITLIILLTNWVVNLNSAYIYIIPLCIIPLLFKAFFDSRIAFFIHSVTIMLLGFIVPNSYEFIFLNIIAGVVTILTSDKDKANEWFNNSETFRDVYSRKPLEYLEIVAKNMTPIWDSEQGKYVSEEEKEDNETASLEEEITFMREESKTDTSTNTDANENLVETTSLDEDSDDDLPF